MAYCKTWVIKYGIIHSFESKCIHFHVLEIKHQFVSFYIYGFIFRKVKCKGKEYFFIIQVNHCCISMMNFDMLHLRKNMYGIYPHRCTI